MIMKKIYIFLILSIFILYIEMTVNSRRNTDIFNSLIKNYGWTQLKDVKNVAYWHQDYRLEDHLGPAKPEKCNHGIRVSTLVLACTYAKELKILFFLFIQFTQHCKSLIKKKSPVSNVYSCVKKLLDILQKMPSIARLMKETLYVLDYLHTHPWKNFVFKLLFLNLENFNNGSRNFLKSKNGYSATEKFLEFIEFFFKYRDIETMCDCSTYCRFEQLNIALIWQKWKEEYNYKNIEDKKLQLYDYLSQKINFQINSIIINKFHNLGFQYDPTTIKIGIPLPVQYRSCYLKLFTRHENTSETIQSESKKNEMKIKFENRWILELIDSFNREVNNVSQTNEELQQIDYLGQVELNNEPQIYEELNLIDYLAPELNNVPQIKEELQQIDHLKQELNNVPRINEELQLIDFIGQGLKNDDSCEDISEPMDTDESRENYIKFF
ncbi:uncharacterized protein LOC126896509 isoform X3 [Daktulosphaira vitifoliae]|uniref:uncharacterized protein LOC126896509 isoform X3 n=1 Tax=Daktulosphaira vitifoliae TaxID=58002 RepID=UPI0021A9F5AA|nr:uncharacterized protein LOC126896509 isoform X3 [Daktulosphaira vitifoliae]